MGSALLIIVACVLKFHCRRFCTSCSPKFACSARFLVLSYFLRLTGLFGWCDRAQTILIDAHQVWLAYYLLSKASMEMLVKSCYITRPPQHLIFHHLHLLIMGLQSCQRLGRVHQHRFYDGIVNSTFQFDGHPFSHNTPEIDRHFSHPACTLWFTVLSHFPTLLRTELRYVKDSTIFSGSVSSLIVLWGPIAGSSLNLRNMYSVFFRLSRRPLFSCESRHFSRVNSNFSLVRAYSNNFDI